MTIRDFIELACDERLEEIIICHCSETEPVENVFVGSCYDALHDDNEKVQEALDTEISSWDMEDGRICLNYYVD